MTFLRLGIDIGSTTAKAVVLDADGRRVFSAYQRHNAQTLPTVQQMLGAARQQLGDVPLRVLLTGSAGMGLSESYALPFIQEVVASAEVVRQRYPDVRTLVDIGGEDAKMIFFDGDGRPPDMRMNGACAGGTGAFIDQMATLLNVSVSELSALALRHTHTYPIAARCGVFAKTDVQNLLAREIAREDIAASIFNAVTMQTLATLARGRTAVARVLFCGGPLTFLPALRTAFIAGLALDAAEVLDIADAELLPALGAALATDSAPDAIPLSGLIERLARKPPQATPPSHRLAPLFAGPDAYAAWNAASRRHQVARVAIAELPDSAPCFLGIDSGSTTTKLVLIDADGRLVCDYYADNRGQPLRAVQQGLAQIAADFAARGKQPRVARSAVTGYGEDLVRAAFDFDHGLVETLAHFRAARHFDPRASFILDIGGQDMKAIFVEHGRIQHIEINEACSSGCGSFIQSFAESLGYTVADFAARACQAEAPCDLGTRCTVFMNSRVKQALREGATIADISAGLAYAVIKNALHKVLKITNTDVLGEHIIVQGGTFRNPAIHKALENLLERPVLCPDVAELMGAFGAALTARDDYARMSAEGDAPPPPPLAPEQFRDVAAYTKRQIPCQGCENCCAITRLTFPNGNVFYTGNRCERVVTNRGERARAGANLIAQKLTLLFDRPTSPAAPPKMTLGIPRVLNMFENFPFWNTLFVESGFAVQLSAPSNYAQYQQGIGTIMSENICFPAKLVHGHIFDLIRAGVDRIFYPMAVFEAQEFADALNCYNCPIVTGYPDVIRSAIDPEGQHGIPLDTPAVNLADHKLLKRVCLTYLADLGVAPRTARRAFDRALTAHHDYRAAVSAAATRILTDARAAGRPVVLLMGRPYHSDALINHNTPEMLVNLGMDIITEDAVPAADPPRLDNRYVLTQWAYPNRYYHAARWAREQADVDVVQLNSFGCGPDALAVDETRALLNAYHQSSTVIRIDEIDSPGSIRLRLRSMLESRPARAAAPPAPQPRPENRLYRKQDRARDILAPQFSFFNRSALIRPLIAQGYPLVMLPPADRQSVEIGLKYTNNEICYPAIILIGDLLKALLSGRYDPETVAVGLTQTGGQCRASCYLSLLKRAMIAAGFEDVPIVSLAAGQKDLHEQPGLKLNFIEYGYRAMLSTMYADALSILYYATATRAREPGAALALADRYLIPMDTGALPLKKAAILDTLQQAVAEFNALPTTAIAYPKAGILGEIYVKYNAFANHHVAQWLIDHEIEVVVPGLTEFFLSWLVHAEAAVQAHTRRAHLVSLLAPPLRKFANAMLDETEAVLHQFKHYTPPHRIEDVAHKARDILALTHQYGEGWLIAGEVGALVESGVHNILCLQPFGCIANHVVAKGVERRIKAHYPQANLLFLDTDAGASEVNYQNRLHFFIDHAKATM